MSLNESYLEEKLKNYASNWPNTKIEIYPSEIVEILDEKDLIIRKLENKIIELKKGFN